MRVLLYIYILGFASIKSVLAQDPLFSQFYSANLYLAPSFAGSTDGGRIGILYRNQWPEIKNQFNTLNFSADYYFPKYHSGLGAYILRDVVGSGKLVSNSVQFQYSYLFRITRRIHVKPGLQVGYITRGVDYRSLLFGDQLSFSGNLPVSVETGRVEETHLFDQGVSVLFYIDNVWLGSGVDHMPIPSQSMLGADNQSPLKISIFGGARFVLKQRLILKDQHYFSFSYLYTKQGPYQQFNIGVSSTKHPIELGVWYRGLPFVKNSANLANQDALIAKIGVVFNSFSFGYSYDYTVSSLRSYSGGAHELSIIYLFNQDQQPDTKKFKALPCPRF